ncbi:hypothetical protein C7U83_28790, partial [Escherichia coli]
MVGDGELKISAPVTTSVGHMGNGTREKTVKADILALRGEPVAGDNVVNIIENGQGHGSTGRSYGVVAGSNV